MGMHANRFGGTTAGAAARAVAARMGTAVAAIIATLAMLLCTLTIGAADAHAADAPDANLGVDLGSGATGYTVEYLYQDGAKDKSLNAVIKWRRDALNDTSVKWEGKTIRQYLADNGISESDYLSPKWSNALERIAIQRAVEANSFSDGHIRLNGEMTWTARYKGYGSSSEILAWGSHSFAGAMDQWAEEKADWVNQTPGAITGHYTTLIDPDYKAYGFGVASSQTYGLVYAGEATPSSGWDETPTNLQGEHTVEANLSVAKMEQGMSVNVPSSLAIGQVFMPIVKADVYDGRFTMRTTWTSPDDSIITVRPDGSLLAKAIGNVTLTCTLTNGGTATFPITVAAFSDVTSKTPHADDISWLADKGISTGWDNQDGSRRFAPMNEVIRQDMAAFLYRLANKPAFDETKARNPFIDVRPSTPHYKEILWLASEGISQGFENPDGSYSFGGDRAVVRQDMAAFLHKLAVKQGKDASGQGGVSFSDVNGSTPHAGDIQWLAKTGVTTGWEMPGGSYEFRGMNDVVRQDMAAFLHRMDMYVLSK